MRRFPVTILALAALVGWCHMSAFLGSADDALSGLSFLRPAEAAEPYQAQGGTAGDVDRTLQPGAVGLWEPVANDTLLYADAGDTLHIEAHTNLGTEQANGFELFLAYHAQYLEPVDRQAREGLQPFASEGLLPNATVLINSAIDLPDTVLGHVRYAEVSLSATVTDTGTVARLSFVVSQPIPGDSTAYVASENDTLFQRVTSFTDPTGRSTALTPRNRIWVRNRPPVLQLPAELSFAEDDSLVLGLDSLVVDPENPPEVMSWEISVVGVAFEARITKGDMQRLVLIPPADWNGEGTLLFVVADPNGVSASSASHLAVASVNDAPVLAPFLADGLEMKEDQPFVASLDTVVTDVDDSHTVLSWSFLGSGDVTAEVDTSAGLLSLTPAADWAGRDTLQIVVSDVAGDSSEVQVPIRVDAVNDPPVFHSELPVIKVSQDTVVDLSEFVTDVDDGPSALSWSVMGAQVVAAEIEPGGKLSLSVPAGWAGEEALTVAVQDAAGRRTLGSLTVGGVVILGDFDEDGKVGFSDYVLFAQNFGRQEGDPGYNARYDLVSSGRIDFQDFVEFATAFGEAP
jgi:hypothetical protein